MALRPVGFVDLPAHAASGGFDHAAVHGRLGRLYVAHTANDAVDVIDTVARRYLRSIPALSAVAGALVSEARDLVFTSNRGEDTVGIVSVDDEHAVTRVPVGVRPNGLAYDPRRNTLLAANVGDPAIPGSHSVSIVDVAAGRRIIDVPVHGRTRWTVFDDESGSFYVNIADPPEIAVIEARAPRVDRVIPIPAGGPHGLDIDAERRRLFCACDAKTLVTVDLKSGAVTSAAPLAGVPDVVFFNGRLARLYVAIGDPGLIEVFDTDTLRSVETVATEPGAHTIAFDAARNTVWAFLPATHRAAVFVDGA